ncbi:MAG: LacI family DNA-binding transcriptional regulator [Actinomycetota bacterium]
MTLQTLADELGVSRTTISNAYNHPEQLSDELRDRILTTAERLGYAGPSAAGRILRTGRHHAIGVVFTDDLRFVFTDPDTTTFLQGVAEACADAGTGVVLLPSPVAMPVDQTALPHAAVDGFLLFSAAEAHPAVQTVIARQRPMLTVDEPDLGAAASFIGIDDRGAATTLTHHLMSLGHERIGAVTLPMSVDRLDGAGRRDLAAATGSPVRVVRERVLGVLDTGVEPVVWEAGANDPDAGRAAALELLRAHPEVTAVIGFSDQLAIGVTQAATRLGLDVPGDVSVVGFDDIPRASTWDVPLTTIRQPLVEKGRLAASELLAMIDDERAPSRHDLPIELVVRRSSGPARAHTSDSSN